MRHVWRLSRDDVGEVIRVRSGHDAVRLVGREDHVACATCPAAYSRASEHARAVKLVLLPAVASGCRVSRRSGRPRYPPAHRPIRAEAWTFWLRLASGPQHPSSPPRVRLASCRGPKNATCGPPVPSRSSSPTSLAAMLPGGRRRGGCRPKQAVSSCCLAARRERGAAALAVRSDESHPDGLDSGLDGASPDPFPDRFRPVSGPLPVSRFGLLPRASAEAVAPGVPPGGSSEEVTSLAVGSPPARLRPRPIRCGWSAVGEGLSVPALSCEPAA